MNVVYVLAVYAAIWLVCGSVHLFLLGARTPEAQRVLGPGREYETTQILGFFLGPLSMLAWAFYLLYSVCRYAGRLGEKWADRER